MLVNKEQLISEMLLLPAAAIDYHISQHLIALFPDMALIETDMHLNIDGYAAAKHCSLSRKTFTVNGPESPGLSSGG